MKKKAAAINGDMRRRAKRRSKMITWAVVVGVVGLLGYGASQMSNIVYDEDDIRVVNFSGLGSTQKKVALEAAHAERCTCGCGMNVAQCVSTDMTCPIRDANIEKIKGMVRTAAATPES